MGWVGGIGECFAGRGGGVEYVVRQPGEGEEEAVAAVGGDGRVVDEGVLSVALRW